jgi:hypothetical protein
MNTSSRRFRLLLASGLAAGLVGALIAGCQTYDFEPVQPLAIAQQTQAKTITARNLKPDLMLLVDKSGSMVLPTDDTNPACGLPDGGVCGYSTPCNGTTCPTRWSDLNSAMDQFLTDDYSVARMGVTFFPAGGTGIDTCGYNSGVHSTVNPSVELDSSNDVDSSLQTTANSIKSQIAATNPGGGTPTADSLKDVGTHYTTYNTTNRQNFVLLLTDGEPNCNANNPNDDSNASACQCTEPGPACTIGSSPLNREVCLDQNATVNEIGSLNSAGIKTIVVGFGAELAGSGGTADAVLTAMANSGGFPCKEIDGGSCRYADGGVRTYYQAANGAELAGALAAIGANVQTGDPCVFALDTAPSDPSFLSVLINGQETPSGADTWQYSNQAVVFQGALCTQIQNSNSANPVKVEIRVVQSL